MSPVAERLEEVRDAAYYDAYYREETFKSYGKFMLWPVWQQVATYLAPMRDPALLELGCGSGGLAHYLRDLGYLRYVGIDFSIEALRSARRRVPASFLCEDVTTFRWDALPHDVLIATEVLEHLADDRAVLRRARPGAVVLFSVPNLNCAGHVRWFGSPRQVADYYRGVLTLQKTEVFTAGTARWFVCHGVRDG